MMTYLTYLDSLSFYSRDLMVQRRGQSQMIHLEMMMMWNSLLLLPRNLRRNIM